MKLLPSELLEVMSHRQMLVRTFVSSSVHPYWSKVCSIPNNTWVKVCVPNLLAEAIVSSGPNTRQIADPGYFRTSGHSRRRLTRGNGEGGRCIEKSSRLHLRYLSGTTEASVVTLTQSGFRFHAGVNHQ